MPDCRFAPAAPEEGIVYGACEPGWDPAVPTVDDWIEFVVDRGIERVCCLLSDAQVAEHDALLDRYRRAFGLDRVAHTPITDHTLADRTTMVEDVLPVLRAADDSGEPVVVHCRAGIGRTGQALAAWLVAARGYGPAEAISTVEDQHRRPTDAVRAGNATREELVALLRAVDDGV